MRHSNNNDEHNQRRRQIVSTMAIVAAQGQAMRALDVDKTDLQPVTGTVAFNSDGVGLIVETERKMFEDKLNEAVSSGLAQTRASGTFFGGEVPTGQMWLLWSLGLTASGAGTLTADQLLAFAEAISVQVNLRSKDKPVQIGGLLDWPDILGSNAGIQTGNGEIGRRTFTYPIVLDPLDSFTLDFTREKAVTIGINSFVQIHGYLRATRIYDERVLALS